MNKKVNFNLTYKDEIGRVTVNIAALSDAWRRNAVFDRPGVAAEFNRRAKALCNVASYHNFGSYRDWPAEDAKKAFSRLVELAKREKVSRIILPIDSHSPS